MRIATSTLNSMLTSTTGSAYADYVNIITKIANNKNFTKISENVPDAKKLLKVNDQLAKLNDYQSNIKAANAEMDLAYDTLDDVGAQLSEINAKIVEASNATTDPASAAAIADTLREKVATIVSLMNTKYMDNYIFSGTNTEISPYSLDEETREVTYSGSSKETGDRLLTIAENTTIAYNVTGDSIFSDITLYKTRIDEETGEEIIEEIKTDFFSEMKDLDELLNSPVLDYDAIREKLDVLKTAQENVTAKAGFLSSKVTKLDTTEEINNNTITNLTEKKKDIEEVDIIKAATELANAQTALQASYAISSSILGSVSLLDYL